MTGNKLHTFAGWMLIGLIVVGILGLLGAVLSLLNSDYLGMGLCLMASAYAFSGGLKAYR